MSAYGKAVRGGCFLAALASTWIAAGTAQAQLPFEESTPPRPAPTATPAPAPAAPAAPAATVSAPAAAAPSAAAPAQAGRDVPDQELWVGHLGVGWYGVSDIPIANAQPGGSGTTPAVDAADDGSAFAKTVAAPAIGARYWLSANMGIDAALGFSASGGSTVTSPAGSPSTTVDKLGVMAFLLHGGLPLSMYRKQHYSFLIIPEINLGIASATVKYSSTKAGAAAAARGGVKDAPPDASLSGMRLDVGARAGAEIYFGFIGLPALALEGSVGLFYTSQSRTATVGSASVKDSDSLITTSSFANPWDFFRTNVAARYYF